MLATTSGETLNIISKNECEIEIEDFFQDLRKNISIETLVILDKILGFRENFDSHLKDPVWETVSMRIKKYSPFLNIDVQRYKKILKQVVL